MEGWRSKQTIASEAMLEAVESHASRFDGPLGTEFSERMAQLDACVKALAEPYATTIDLVYRTGQPLDAVAAHSAVLAHDGCLDHGVPALEDARPETQQHADPPHSPARG